MQALGSCMTNKYVLHCVPYSKAHVSAQVAYSREIIHDEPGPNILHTIFIADVRYSEGQPGARYYGGNEHIDRIEWLCKARALQLYGLNEDEWSVNVQVRLIYAYYCSKLCIRSAIHSSTLIFVFMKYVLISQLTLAVQWKSRKFRCLYCSFTAP